MVSHINARCFSPFLKKMKLLIVIVSWDKQNAVDRNVDAVDFVGFIMVLLFI